MAEYFVFEDNEVDTRGLIVHLPLFSQTAQQAQGFVQNLNVLDFNCNEITFPGGSEDKTTWRVTAVVCHTGDTPNHGHYWAYRRVQDSDKDFIMIDDENVTAPRVPYDRFRAIPKAYLLFMERNWYADVIHYVL